MYLCKTLGSRAFLRSFFFAFVGSLSFSLLLAKYCAFCNKLYLRDYGIIRAFIDINKIYLYL